MKAFFLVAVVLLVLLAAFAIANAVFSDQNSQSQFDSTNITSDAYDYTSITFEPRSSYAQMRVPCVTRSSLLKVVSTRTSTPA